MPLYCTVISSVSTEGIEKPALVSRLPASLTCCEQSTYLSVRKRSGAVDLSRHGISTDVSCPHDSDRPNNALE
jgi:hypothetical protein